MLTGSCDRANMMIDNNLMGEIQLWYPWTDSSQLLLFVSYAVCLRLGNR